MLLGGTAARAAFRRRTWKSGRHVPTHTRQWIPSKPDIRSQAHISLKTRAAFRLTPHWITLPLECHRIHSGRLNCAVLNFHSHSFHLDLEGNPNEDKSCSTGAFVCGIPWSGCGRRRGRLGLSRPPRSAPRRPPRSAPSSPAPVSKGDTTARSTGRGPVLLDEQDQQGIDRYAGRGEDPAARDWAHDCPRHRPHPSTRPPSPAASGPPT